MATLYRKIGRKYCAVGEEVILNKLPYGAHLVIVDRGQKTTIYNINPAYAELIAAGETAKDAMVETMLATEKVFRPISASLTNEQKRMVKALENSGFEPRFGMASLHEIARAGVNALIEKARMIDAKAEDLKEST